MPITPEALAAELTREREGLHAAAWPRSVALAGFVAVALVLLLRPWASAQGLQAWAAMLLLALGARTWIGYRHRKALQLRAAARPEAADARLWIWRHRLVYAFHGSVWALACLFLNHATGLEEISPLVFFIVAMSAGALIATSFDLTAGLCFSLPPTAALLLALPLALPLTGSSQGSVMAAIAALTVALAWLGARRAQQLMVTALKNQLTLAEQGHRAQQAQRQAERAQLALTRQHGLFDQLLRSTAEGFWFVDNHGVGTDANPAMCRMLGRPLETLRGRSVMEFFSGEDLATMQREIAARQQGQHSATYEIGIDRPDGSRIYCLNHATALFDTEGQKFGSVGIWTDITQRREAEAALRLHKVVNNSITDLVSVISEGQVYRMVNDAWCEASSLTRDQALGKLTTDLLRREDNPDRARAFEACIRTRQPTTVSGMVHHLDGRSRHLETTFTPLVEPLNGETCLVCISRDVTEREVARQALELGAEYLRRTLGATGDAIFASDSEDVDAPLPFSNDQMLALWGITLADGRPLTVRTIMAHATPLFAEPEAELQRIQALIAHNAPDESHVLLRDGRTLLRRLQPARVAGRVVRVWSFRDITAEVQRLQVVQRAEAQLRAVLDAFPGFIGRLDADLTYTYANRAFAQLFGQTPEQVVGQSARELLGPARVSALLPVARQVLAGEKVTYEHHHLFHDQATELDSQVTLAPGRDPATGAAAIYGFGIDISARKAAERALEMARDEAQRANLAKSEFLSHMSHELRTPLNAVLGFGQLLVSDETPKLAPKQQAWTQEILHGARHLLSLINEILDLGRIEAGHLQLNVAVLKLGALVQECQALLQPLAQSRDVSVLLQQSAPWTAAAVHADPVRLKQVLLNLMSNAVKYNHRGGQVELRCRLEADAVWLGVRDNGPGIRAQDQRLLFQPFERLAAAGSAVEGTGIGLALSQRLVLAMGGSIGVDSEWGAGSLFWFRLPRAVIGGADPVAQPPLQVPSAHPVAAPTQQVLYIEDNAVNISLMQAMLARLPDVELVCAELPLEGLRLARSLKPALILTDIQLPGMDGFQVLDRLRAHETTRSIPVVAVSANALQSDVDAALAAGFQGYLAKPLDLDLLLDTVRLHLARVS